MRKFHHQTLGRTRKGGFFTSLALAIGAGVGGGMAISNALKPKQKSKPPAPVTPKAVEPTVKDPTEMQAAAKEKANELALKKRRARTKTVRTGPRGVLSQARTESKSLTGE